MLILIIIIIPTFIIILTFNFSLEFISFVWLNYPLYFLYFFHISKLSIFLSIVFIFGNAFLIYLSYLCVLIYQILTYQLYSYVLKIISLVNSIHYCKYLQYYVHNLLIIDRLVEISSYSHLISIKTTLDWLEFSKLIILNSLSNLNFYL